MSSSSSSKRSATSQEPASKRARTLKSYFKPTSVQRSNGSPDPASCSDASAQRSAIASSSVERSDVGDSEVNTSFETTPLMPCTSVLSETGDEGDFPTNEDLIDGGFVLSAARASSCADPGAFSDDDLGDAEFLAAENTASASVTFRDAILVPLLQQISSWAMSRVKDTDSLKAISVHELADVCLDSMPPSLVQYLDQSVDTGCDLTKVISLAHPRGHARNRVGGYFFLLQHKTKQVSFPYVGTCSRLSNKRMETRLDEHENTARQKSQKQKTLYKVWDVSHVHCRVLWTLPLSFLVKYGNMTNLLLETAFAILFLGAYDWHKPGTYRDTGFDIAQMSLDQVLNFFKKTQALQTTYGKNISIPVLEMSGKNALLRLSEGPIQVMLCFSKKGEIVVFLGEYTITITQDQWPSILRAGFSVEKRLVELEVILSDEASQQNWANLSVKDQGITATNPEGYEKAHHVLLKMTFVDANGESQSTFLRRSTRHINALQRACEAMSLYEFSTGVLPRDAFGPRRRDFATPLKDQGQKCWTQEAHDSHHPGMAYQCPGCSEKFLASVTQHSLTYHFETKTGKTACFEPWSIENPQTQGKLTFKNLKETLRIPGVVLSDALSHCELYYCLGCSNKGFGQKGDFKGHFLPSGNKSDPARLEACRRKCGVTAENFSEKAAEFLMTRSDYVERCS